MRESVRELLDSVRVRSLLLVERYLRFGGMVLADSRSEISMIVAILGRLARREMSEFEREEVVRVVRQVTFYDYCSDSWLKTQVDDFFVQLY